jgi:hypothetical protein
MRIKSRTGSGLCRAFWSIEHERAETPQARWNQGSASSLAEANEEIPAAKIDGFQRLPGPTQSVVPRKVAIRKANVTFS